MPSHIPSILIRKNNQQNQIEPSVGIMKPYTSNNMTTISPLTHVHTTSTKPEDNQDQKIDIHDLNEQQSN